MSGILKNELMKLFAKKKIYIFMAIILIMTVISALIFKFGNTTVMVGQRFPIESIKMNAGMLLPIFMSIIVGDIITEEYKNGTLKIPLIHPISRVKLLNSKIITVFFSLSLLMFFSMVISYVIGIIFFEWGANLEINNISFSSLNAILVTIILHLITILPLLAFSSIIIAAALKLTSSGAVVGISIGILFGLNILGQLFEKIKPFLINTYFNPLIFIGNPQGNWLGALIILIYGLVPYFIGLKVFKEKDLLY